MNKMTSCGWKTKINELCFLPFRAWVGFIVGDVFWIEIRIWTAETARASGDIVVGARGTLKGVGGASRAVVLSGSEPGGEEGGWTLD